MPRPVPVPLVAVLWALLGLGASLGAGALIVFLVVGADAAAVVAGAAACACGVVVGSRERPALALALGMVAAASLAIALGADERERGVQLAFPARATMAPPPPVRPAAPAETAPAPQRFEPRTVVSGYYAALDRGDYARAWARLAPAVRTAFGGFDAWRAGYATTLGHEIEDVTVANGVVTHVLVATDRTPCGGETERRFAVTWRFEGRRVAQLSATKLSGADPSAAC
jgi:ketosteroid isomerase-like protein